MMNLLPGIARKVALLFWTACVAGWVIFLGGFSGMVHQFSLNNSTIADPFWFPHWLYLIGGMVGVSLLCASLCVANNCLAVFDGIYISAVFLSSGAVIYVNILLLLACNSSDSGKISCSSDLRHTDLVLKVQTAGCALSSVSLIFYLMAQHYFEWPETQFGNFIFVRANEAYGSLRCNKAYGSLRRNLNENTPISAKNIVATNATESEGRLDIEYETLDTVRVRGQRRDTTAGDNNVQLSTSYGYAEPQHLGWATRSASIPAVTPETQVHRDSRTQHPKPVRSKGRQSHNTPIPLPRMRTIDRNQHRIVPQENDQENGAAILPRRMNLGQQAPPSNTSSSPPPSRKLDTATHTHAEPGSSTADEDRSTSEHYVDVEGVQRNGGGDVDRHDLGSRKCLLEASTELT